MPDIILSDRNGWYECIHSVPIWYARVAKYARQNPRDGSTDRPCPVLDVDYIPCLE